MNDKKNGASAKLRLSKTKLRELAVRTNLRTGSCPPECDAGTSSNGGASDGSRPHYVQ